MPSAKQQPSNIKHSGAIRPNVWVLTFGPPCTITDFSSDFFHYIPKKGCILRSRKWFGSRALSRLVYRPVSRAHRSQCEADNIR